MYVWHGMKLPIVVRLLGTITIDVYKLSRKVSFEECVYVALHRNDKRERKNERQGL